jgi:hypothetical protein
MNGDGTPELVALSDRCVVLRLEAADKLPPGQ